MHQDYPLVRVLGQKNLQLFSLCFFGNTRQSLNEFVITELGHRRYEHYTIDINSRFISDRYTLEALLHYASQRDRLKTEPGKLDIASLQNMAATLPDHRSQPQLRRRYARLVNQIARQLERLDAIDAATALYQLAQLPPARERLARIAAKSDQRDAAIRLCDTLIASPLSDDEFDFAQQFRARLLRQKPPPQTPWPELSLASPPDSAGVEQAALALYQQQGFVGAHTENTLFNGLFGLCFWDILYAPVSQAFGHPYQLGPADVFDEDFARVRAAPIHRRLNEVLQGAQWPQMMRDTFQAKQGINNFYVNWDQFDSKQLAMALDHIPRLHLAAIFKRLLQHPGGNRSGFPDLCVYRHKEYRLVEVKGPGDTLQKNQRRWLHYFVSQGIPCEVCRIRYTDD